MVWINGITSDWTPILSGVPKGSVHGLAFLTFLFRNQFFTDDISLMIIHDPTLSAIIQIDFLIEMVDFLANEIYFLSSKIDFLTSEVDSSWDYSRDILGSLAQICNIILRMLRISWWSITFLSQTMFFSQTLSLGYPGVSLCFV